MTTYGMTLSDFQVLKAARLLCKPPLEVHFVDEQEMRCVYSLIYDVFRCELHSCTKSHTSLSSSVYANSA